MPESGVGTVVETAVAAALARAAGPVVLAVSGGADSMVLLHSVAAVASDRVAAVATFDHGTGAAARAAVALVHAMARGYGLDVTTDAAPPTTRARGTEAEWRAARWAFLRRVARERGATVATGHTRDDQIETVVIRVLRGAGARGLAGLDVDSDVVRPLLDVDRATARAYGRVHDLEWVEDPSNASRAHLRNRVRLELLPAMRAARPEIEGTMLALGARAAEWRRELEALVTARCPVRRTADGMSVAVADLAQYDHHTVAVVWPVIAARAGVTLDRRGTSRLAAFTFNSKVGGTIQLSGGVEVVRSRFLFVIRPLW
jgi:tRNA(Ile)-lysidine synthase